MNMLPATTLAVLILIFTVAFIVTFQVCGKINKK